MSARPEDIARLEAWERRWEEQERENALDQAAAKARDLHELVGEVSAADVSPALWQRADTLLEGIESLLEDVA